MFQMSAVIFLTSILGPERGHGQTVGEKILHHSRSFHDFIEMRYTGGKLMIHHDGQGCLLFLDRGRTCRCLADEQCAWSYIS